jgi:hypothetical protein
MSDVEMPSSKNNNMSLNWNTMGLLKQKLREISLTKALIYAHFHMIIVQHGERIEQDNERKFQGFLMWLSDQVVSGKKTRKSLGNMAKTLLGIAKWNDGERSDTINNSPPGSSSSTTTTTTNNNDKKEEKEKETDDIDQPVEKKVVNIKLTIPKLRFGDILERSIEDQRIVALLMTEYAEELANKSKEIEENLKKDEEKVKDREKKKRELEAQRLIKEKEDKEKREAEEKARKATEEKIRKEYEAKMEELRKQLEDAQEQTKKRQLEAELARAELERKKETEIKLKELEKQQAMKRAEEERRWVREASRFDDKNFLTDDFQNNKDIVWVSANDLGMTKFASSPEYDPSEPEFASNDVIQGQIGNCWFISAMSLVASHPPMMKRLFEEVVRLDDNGVSGGGGGGSKSDKGTYYKVCVCVRVRCCCCCCCCLNSMQLFYVCVLLKFITYILFSERGRRHDSVFFFFF